MILEGIRARTNWKELKDRNRWSEWQTWANRVWANFGCERGKLWEEWRNFCQWELLWAWGRREESFEIRKMASRKGRKKWGLATMSVFLHCSLIRYTYSVRLTDIKDSIFYLPNWYFTCVPIYFNKNHRFNFFWWQNWKLRDIQYRKIILVPKIKDEAIHGHIDISTIKRFGINIKYLWISLTYFINTHKI